MDRSPLHPTNNEHGLNKIGKLLLLTISLYFGIFRLD